MNQDGDEAVAQEDEMVEEAWDREETRFGAGVWKTEGEEGREALSFEGERDGETETRRGEAFKEGGCRGREE